MTSNNTDDRVERFTLDTSGAVSLPSIRAMPYRAHDDVASGVLVRWPDLSPFEQGYVEAMFASANTFECKGECLAPCAECLDDPTNRRVGFTDLAPETLAAIRKDCADRHPLFQDNAAGGRRFWITRQLHGLADFPPLALAISEDGKVRFQ